MKLFNYVLVGMMATSMAYAQKPGSQIGGGVLTPLVLPSGEKLDITNEQIAPLISQYMKEYFDRQKEDRVFFEKSIRELEAAFNKFNTDVVIQTLQKRADESVAGTMIPALDFLALGRNYQAEKSLIETKIQGILNMQKGALPSAAGISITQKMKGDIPAYLNLDFAPIASYYTDRLTKIQAVVDQLVFNIYDKMNIKHRNVGLKLTIKLTLMSPDEIAKDQAEIIKLRKAMDVVKRKQDEQFKLVHELVREFVSNFGTSERLRKLDEKDLEARKDAFERITQAFWIRSYLRVKYGMPLGTFNIKFKKSWANIDQFLTKPEDFITWDAYPVRAQKDLERSKQNFREYVELGDRRTKMSTEAYPSIFDNAIDFMAKAGNLWHWLRGQSTLQEVAILVVNMMAKDVHEELLLASFGGQAKVTEYYRKRYYATDEMKKQFQEYRCYVDAADAGDICKDIGNNYQEALTGDARSKFVEISGMMKAQVKSFEIARVKQEQLDLINENTTPDAIKKNLKGLD